MPSRPEGNTTIQSHALFPLSWRDTASGSTQPTWVYATPQRPGCQLSLRAQFWLSAPLQLPVLQADGLIHIKVTQTGACKVAILCSEPAAISSSLPSITCLIQWCSVCSSMCWKDLENSKMLPPTCYKCCMDSLNTGTLHSYLKCRHIAALSHTR